MTLTDMARQKSSLSASASRLTDAGRKSYMFSGNWPQTKRRSQQDGNTIKTVLLHVFQMCADLETILSHHVISLRETKSNICQSVTSIRREFEQQDATGPQRYEAQAEGQRVGRRAGAQPGAGTAAHHGSRTGTGCSQTCCNTLKTHTHGAGISFLGTLTFGFRIRTAI